jgi:hypothetical protein
VFLLDVAEDQDIVGADCTSIAKQIACTRFDESFIRDVREHESFRAHERCAARVRHREGRAIRAGEDLDAERQRCCTADGVADDAHRGDDLRSDRGAFQVRTIAVLENQSMKSCSGVDLGFGRGCIGDRAHGVTARGCARSACAWMTPISARGTPKRDWMRRRESIAARHYERTAAVPPCSRQR